MSNLTINALFAQFSENQVQDFTRKFFKWKHEEALCELKAREATKGTFNYFAIIDPDFVPSEDGKKEFKAFLIRANVTVYEGSNLLLHLYNEIEIYETGEAFANDCELNTWLNLVSFKTPYKEAPFELN